MLFSFLNISFLTAQENEDSSLSDHEKAIKAVNDGEILNLLDQTLEKINSNFEGRVISIDLEG